MDYRIIALVGQFALSRNKKTITVRKVGPYLSWYKGLNKRQAIIVVWPS